MFTRVLDFVQAYKTPLDAGPSRQPALSLLDLALATPFIYRKGKLGIDELQSEFASLIRLLKRVCKTKLEVHGVGMRKVLEKSKKLNNVVLFDDLETESVCRPLLVNRDNHASAGNGERRRKPIKLDLEAGNGELECMQVVERVES